MKEDYYVLDIKVSQCETEQNVKKWQIRCHCELSQAQI